MRNSMSNKIINDKKALGIIRTKKYFARLNK